MGQTLVRNYVHIVFHTKHSQPIIKPTFEDELYAYVGGICNKLDCQVIQVGGHKNHIHILCMLSKNVSLSELLRNIKTDSSKWVKTKDASLPKTYWQNGYGAFSVPDKGVKFVKKYIENQHQHHAKMDHKSEYLKMLKDNDTEFDERYIWD